MEPLLVLVYGGACGRKVGAKSVQIVMSVASVKQISSKTSGF